MRAPPSAVRCLSSAVLLLLFAAGCVDVPRTPDALVGEAGATDVGRDGDADDPPDAACMPAEEVCNGRDDDCDGTIDEDDPALCGRCVRTRELGACAEGRQVCADGALICAAVGAPPGDGCDLIDGDCDGRRDEAGEQPTLRDVRVARQCPGTVAAWNPVDRPGRCADDDETFCGPVHPCLDGECLDRCEQQAGIGYAACAMECPLGPENTPCRARCRDEAQPELEACFAGCRPLEPGVDRWRCMPSAPGPLCAVAACADGARLVDGRCVSFEICNNGVDDNGDGLVDGDTQVPGTCEAVFEQGPATPIGACPQGLPGCDGVVGTPGPVWSCADDCPYAPTLAYDYALDVEEVSNRAWFACVRDGVCSEPAGLAWLQAAVLMRTEMPPTRPAAGETPGCAEPVRLDPRVGAPIDPRVVDLPVVGVSWCQARDYCLWAGKRLPTEVEWERAGSGREPRRTWPWGSIPPAACDAAQCCGTEGQRPPSCTADPLPACPEAPAGGPVRTACQATVGQGDPACNPPDPSCPDCLPSPAPVWANVDGATPEGVLNLAGNVAEWTFDWASLGYAGAVELDPVGAACDALSRTLAGQQVGPGQRITRGGDFLRTGLPTDLLSRIPFPPGAQIPAVGFRCARTVQSGDDGLPELCDPGTQGRPTRPVEAERPLCQAPDFDDDLGALGLCPGDRRVPSRTCTEGQGRTCATDTALDCGTWIVRRLELETQSIDGLIAAILAVAPPNVRFERPALEPVTAEFIGRLFNGDLVPNGGRSLLVLDTGCDFGGNGLYPSRMVNGAVVGRDLVEMGLIDQQACRPLQTPEIPVVTQAMGIVDSVCHHGRGEMYIEGLGARIPYSGLMLYDIALDAARTELAGAMLHVISLADGADSTLGDDTDGAIRDFLVGVGAPPTDLCFLQQMGAILDTANNPQGEARFGRWSCGDFMAWPGCLDGVCQGGDDRCMGWAVPIRVEATARAATDLGYSPCSCEDEGPVEPPPG